MSSKLSALTTTTALTGGSLAYTVPAGGGTSNAITEANRIGNIGVSVPDFQFDGEFEFGKWLFAQGVDATTISNLTALSATQWTTYLQNFLLYVQTQFLLMKNSAQYYDDLTAFSCAKAQVNVGLNISLNCPIVVPRYVALDATGQRFIRVGNAGTVTSNYTGDTTTQACANLYQPLFIFVPGSHNVGQLDIQCNSVGTDRGAAVSAGRTWGFKSVASIVSGGTNWTVGDTFTINLGDTKYPYNTATGTVASVSSGAVTGITFAPTRWNTNSGVMGLPPVLQQKQWTSANGYNVFSGTPSLGQYKTTYLVSTNSGSGLVVTMNFWADWESGNTIYHGIYSNAQTYPMYLSYIHAEQANTTASGTKATYGNLNVIQMSCYETQFEGLYANGGDYGIYVTGTDVRGSWMNAVNSGVSFAFRAGGSAVCSNLVSDTPFVHHLELDKFSGAWLGGNLINNGGTGFTSNTTASMVLSSNDTSGVTGCNINLSCYGAGSSSGIPAASLAYGNSNIINILVNNLNYAGTAYTCINTSFMTIGSGWGSSNTLTGSIDNVTGQIDGGTVHTGETAIWDVSAAAVYSPNGIYAMAASGTPTSGGSGTLVNKANLGSIYTNTSTGNQYINTGSRTSPSWVVKAYSSGNASDGVATVTHSQSPYTIKVTDSVILVDTTSGAVTLTAPSPSASPYPQFTVKDSKGNFGTNACTLAQHASEQIEGVAASLVMSANWGNYTFASNGTNWFKVGAATNLALVTYTSHGTQTWTCPAGVTQVIATGRGGSGGGGGGGSGGGGSTATAAYGGCAGGSGAPALSVTTNLTVVPNTSYTLTIGAGGATAAGGAAGAANASGSSGNAGTAGNAGANTTFGSLFTWLGGGGGGAGGAGAFASTGSGGFGAVGPYGLNGGTGGTGGAANTAGNSGGTTYANSATAAYGGVGTGGAAGGTGGGGGGGANGSTPPGDGAGGSGVNGGAGGASGANGSQAAAATTATGGAGGQGGAGGGGGGLKASTGSQGGAGQAGAAGVDGLITFTWLE